MKIWSEIELAYRFLNGSLVGITGSNGKTTTTALIEHILRGAGLPTLFAGNIGTPLISLVEQTKKNTVTVVELSSFQLELIDTFRPNVGLFLNLTPDHLDRHHTLKAYGDAKARIFENQTADDAAILNADDAGAAAYAPSKPQVYWFSRKQRVAQGAYLRGEEVVLRIDGEDHTVLRRGEIPLAGAHNLENVLAATIATKLGGRRSARRLRRESAALPESSTGSSLSPTSTACATYNDSKATNVDATLKALDAFPGRILIILGGKDKDSDYTVLQQPLREKAILALLIGAAAEKIEKQIAGSVAIESAGTIDRAVEIAARTAHPGDIVLLAPACASFDQFENYEQRGRIFKDLVRRLQSSDRLRRSRRRHRVQRGDRRRAKNLEVGSRR